MCWISARRAPSGWTRAGKDSADWCGQHCTVRRNGAENPRRSGRSGQLPGRKRVFHPFARRCDTLGLCRPDGKPLLPARPERCIWARGNAVYAMGFARSTGVRSQPVSDALCCGRGRRGGCMLFYGAHAGSLRSDNTKLSRDFPGLLCDQAAEATGENTIVCPGAAGGLLMTGKMVRTNSSRGAWANLRLTAERLAEYTLSIATETERALSPKLALSRQVFTVPLDNMLFALCQQPGILDSRVVAAESATEYGVESERAVLRLDGVAVTLIPRQDFSRAGLYGRIRRCQSGRGPSAPAVRNGGRTWHFADAGQRAGQ